MKTLLETLQSGSQYLDERGVDDARLNMEHITAKVLGCQRIDLYLAFDRPMEESELEILRNFLKRRGKREPLQHILGEVEFLGREFICDARALIPRSETEELVGILLKRFMDAPRPRSVIDVGCGSGVIGISLAAKWLDSHVTLVDLSSEALSLTKENAKRIGIEDDRVSYIESDLLNKVEGAFDLVVANLPYVSSEDMDKLDPELGYDPRPALEGGKDGTEIISCLISQLSNRMTAGDLLALEIGEGQASFFLSEINEIGFSEEHLLKDLSGIDRFILAMR